MTTKGVFIIEEAKPTDTAVGRVTIFMAVNLDLMLL